MEEFSPYTIVIAVCSVIIISFFFNQIAKRSNLPGVLMLIALGMAIKYILDRFEIYEFTGEQLRPILTLLGITGLIMIVLEAALDLTLSRDKKPVILSSFFMAFFALIGTTLLVAVLLSEFVFNDFLTSIVYAIPLSIMSSAIIIPSVANLAPGKKEFLIYESTLSDILGIMLFYFLIEGLEKETTTDVLFYVSTNIALTIVLSFALSYLLVLGIQRLGTKENLFFLIAILISLYAIGKIYHLSALVIILVFGLVLSNHQVFFFGRMKKLLNVETLETIKEEFHLVTIESAFVVRTFFFVVFGMAIDWADLLNLQTALIGSGVAVAVFVVRFIFLRLINSKNIIPELFIAPRGLITILLFYNIPLFIATDSFSMGIILYAILITSLAMAIVLIFKGRVNDYVGELNFENWEELDEEIEELRQG